MKIPVQKTNIIRMLHDNLQDEIDAVELKLKQLGDEMDDAEAYLDQLSKIKDSITINEDNDNET